VVAIAIAAAAFAMTASATPREDGFAGRWNIEMQMHRNVMRSTITLTQDESGAWAGVWEGRRGTVPLEDVPVVDGVLRFARTADSVRERTRLEAEAHLDAEVMVGRMQTPTEWREFTATRAES
jgi:hypothetical protein